MKKLLLLLVGLSLTFNLYAGEVITGFEDKDLPVLNEELRKMRHDIDAFVDTDTDTDTDVKVKASSDDPTADYLDGKIKNSLVIDSEKAQLSGDSASPGNTKLYGTNGAGTKGWYDQPSAGSAGSQVFTSSGTFTAPTGITTVWITLIGGGGGGGAGNGGGGGGSAAWYITFPYIVIPANNYSVTVGAAGIGGINAPGGNGGDTIFDNLNVDGGKGGDKSGGGGAGGSAVLFATICAPSGRTGGGQGYISNAGVAGAAGSGETGGGGAGSIFGAGGNGGASGQIAYAGTGYGTGGGGGGGSYPDISGKDGAAGLCIVEY